MIPDLDLDWVTVALGASIVLNIYLYVEIVTIRAAIDEHVAWVNDFVEEADDAYVVAGGEDA